MNIVILHGNLVADPTSAEIDSKGKKVLVTNFTIAVSRHFTKSNGEKGETTTYIDCEAWAGGAETIQAFAKKGQPILINGSLINNSYIKEGITYHKIKIRVNNFTLLQRSNYNKSKENVEDPATVTNTD